jgi:hypothetical protein
MDPTTDEEQPTMHHDPSKPTGDRADEIPQPPPASTDRPAVPQPLRGILRVAGRPPRSGGERRVRFADGVTGGECSRSWDAAKARAAAAAATAAVLVGRPRGVRFFRIAQLVLGLARRWRHRQRLLLARCFFGLLVWPSLVSFLFNH